MHQNPFSTAPDTAGGAYNAPPGPVVGWVPLLARRSQAPFNTKSWLHQCTQIVIIINAANLLTDTISKSRLLASTTVTRDQSHLPSSVVKNIIIKFCLSGYSKSAIIALSWLKCRLARQRNLRFTTSWLMSGRLSSSWRLTTS